MTGTDRRRRQSGPTLPSNWTFSCVCPAEQSLVNLNSQAADAVIGRVRAICMALPEVTERVSHGEPAWFVRRAPQFAMMFDHHHDDRVGLHAAAPPGAQEGWIAEDAERFFYPPYVGGRGWVGVRLDVDHVDWDDVADVIEDAYRAVAPKALIAILDAESN